ncbi:NAD synthetase [Aphanothece hegewaldii CCALA 016]|uniref:NAD synthetase n=1 Tax=Aphanothece hegewaldii CCALA 016 TaxID=2107694 RepID=A0A2T1LYZ5_9CHRO|nr:NAD synthetase [Aphanothece hegewaldii CCALA 016]
MEANTSLDWILLSLAVLILVGGLLMLLSGVREMGKKP